MNIAFIGFGNMANALVRGVLSADNITLADNLYIFHNKTKNDYSLDKCTFLNSSEECNNSFDIIFLCVKPVDLEKAILENSKIFKDNQIIVSVVAGITIDSIKKNINKNIAVVRAMPNLCAIFNESITGLCAENTINEASKDYVENIFKCVGHIRNIDEDEMHLFTALYGSGPAYIMYFIESLVDCDDFKNITKEDKSLLILHMLNSTSKMLFVTENINDLRSKVTSKKGTTEAALKIFEKNNFNKIIKDAIKGAKNNSIDIANKKK